MEFRVKYYGVRGSTPTCGEQFNKIGGNTTCVLVETEEHLFIIDGGTGIRILGLDIMAGKFGKKGSDLTLLFTHTHWDHIQGLPFFIPGYIPGNKLDIYGESKLTPILDENGREKKENWDIQRTLQMQQSFMYFPASLSNMGAAFSYNEVKENKALEIHGVTIRTLKMYHPNDTLGFRFEKNGKSFVFCTDVEHNDAMSDKLAAFAEGCDVLAMDSQYTPEEYEQGKQGWGHSTFLDGATISRKAQARKYHLIHHDPMHDDTFLINLEKRARGEFSESLLIPEGHSFEL